MGSSSFCPIGCLGPPSSTSKMAKSSGPYTPGAQKYVKEWPFRLCWMVLGHYCTYFGGPGTSYTLYFGLLGHYFGLFWRSTMTAAWLPGFRERTSASPKPSELLPCAPTARSASRRARDKRISSSKFPPPQSPTGPPGPPGAGLCGRRVLRKAKISGARSLSRWT